MDTGELYSSLQLRRDPEGEGSAKEEQDPNPPKYPYWFGLLTFPVSFFYFLLAMEGQKGKRQG